MHPLLWSGLGVEVPAYGALLVGGFLLGLLLVRQRAPQLGLDPGRMTEVAAQLTLAGALGSRLWFVLSDADRYLARPARVLAVWDGGHVWYGALAGGLAALAWHARRTAPLRTLGDLFLPAASLAHLCGRLGCFLAGCCWGRPADVPWAVVFPSGSLCDLHGVPLHPTQLYEAAGEAAIYVVLLWLWPRRGVGGEIGLAYLALYALLRLAVEPFRGDDDRGFVFAGALSAAQLTSLLLLLLAVAALAWAGRRPARQPVSSPQASVSRPSQPVAPSPPSTQAGPSPRASLSSRAKRGISVSPPPQAP